MVKQHMLDLLEQCSLGKPRQTGVVENVSVHS